MQLVMQVKYVIKRGSTYYFKINIPKDCRSSFDGKSEIQKSLKTDDIEQAKAQAEKLGRMWKEKIGAARSRKEQDNSGPNTPVVNVDAIAEDFRKQTAPYIQLSIHSNQIKSKSDLRQILHVSLENSIETYQKCILIGTFTDQELANLVNPFAEGDQLAWDACAQFEPRALLEDDILARVARRIVPIILEGLLSVKTALEQELYPHHAVTLTGAPAPTATGMRISEVLNEMLQATSRAGKTDFNIRANVQLLIDWLGDIPVADITKANLIEFRDNCLQKLPVNMSKKPEYADLSIKQILTACKEDTPISNRTVNNKITSVAQVLNYAVENRYMDYASTKNLKIEEDNDGKERAMNTTELQAMVALLKENEKRPSRYWIPLEGHIVASIQP